LIKGITITDVIFEDDIGISNKTIKSLIGTKDGEEYRISIDANTYYDCIESCLITNRDKGKEVKYLITMPTACDTCTKMDCKDRSNSDSFVIDCKIKVE
jgi:hypothetical protein